MPEEIPVNPAVVTTPTVKLIPDFKVGETVIHKDAGTEHTVIAVIPGNVLRLSGLAALTYAYAVEKKL